MRKIKICYFINGLANGGAEAVMFNYITHMDRNKFEVNLITYNAINDKKTLNKFEKENIKVFIIPLWKKNFVKSCKSTIKIFKDENYDIIHSHMTDLNWLPLLLALITARGKRNVRISHSHMSYCNIRLSIKQKILYAIESFLGGIVATDYFACGVDAGISLFGKKNVDRGRVYIMHNALDIRQFLFSDSVRMEYRNKLGLEGSFVIGNIARFEEQKNHVFIIQLFEKFVQLYPDSKLLLVGCGSQESKIKLLVHRKNLDDKVIFWGTTNKINILYQVMDVFVLPSLYEGLGVVCIEAQAAGLPILCSENITKEVKIIDLLEFLPIKNGFDIWIQKLLSLIKFNRKKIDIDVIHNSGYDIETETYKLEKKYELLLRKTK